MVRRTVVFAFLSLLVVVAANGQVKRKEPSKKVEQQSHTPSHLKEKGKEKRIESSRIDTMSSRVDRTANSRESKMVNSGETTRQRADSLYQQGLVKYNAENYFSAFKLLLEAASLGDARAQYYLGKMYVEGIGVGRDETEAFKWAEKSANQEDPMGQNLLGTLYEEGTGTTKDESRAFAMFGKSAEGGWRKGQSNLARCYLYGVGTAKNYDRAFTWAQTSANQNDVTGMGLLAMIYMFGLGVEKDLTLAGQWIRKAAEGGEAFCQLNLGDMYHSGVGGVNRD